MTRLVKHIRAAIDANKGASSIVVSLLVANMALMVWYLFYGYQSGFHSDSAAKVLLAREIVETGQYFPHDWNYVNGDLFVLFGHTFIVPLLFFFPAGYFVHAISGLVSAALILSGAWFLTSLFEIEKLKRITIVAVLSAGLSGFLAENLYGQVSYGAVFYFTCYTIYFAWKFLSSSGHRKVLYGSGLLLVLLLAFYANPLRATLSYGLPLLFAVTYYVICRTNISKYTSREVRVGYVLIAVIFLSIAIGVTFHAITLLSVNNVLGAGQVRWLSFDDMIRNTMLTMKGFLAILGGLPSAGNMVDKISGVYDAIRLTASLALLVLMPLSLRAAFLKKLSGTQFVASFALVSVLLVLFIQLTTTVPDMSDPVQSSRYLTPSLLLLLIIVLAQSHEFTKKPLLTLAATAVTIVFITSAYPTFVRSNSNSGINWGQPGQYHSHLKNLKDFLLSNNLRYGYATYWNAGVLSVLSEEKVLVRQIAIDRGLPMPMRHLSSNRWYRPKAWQGETFLLLTTQEAAAINWDVLERYHAKPVRELNFEEFKIFVFAQNIAKDIPGWDRRYESPVSYIASKDSMHYIGKYYDSYENNGSALVAGIGEIGALHYGPYIGVDSGTYTVSFDVKVDSAPNGAARLDVAAGGQRILAETILIDNNTTQQLRFNLDKLDTLEFRVWSLGSARVVFRSVSIVRSEPIK